MLFSAPIFLYVFLPAGLLAYALAGRRLRLGLLVGLSWVFYAWGDPRQLPLLWLSTLGNYALGRWIGTRLENGQSPRLPTALGVGLNLAGLGFYKYGAFLLVNLDLALAPLGVGVPSGVMAYFTALSQALPAGISFFTFQAVSYLFDVSRRLHPAQKNLLRFAFYLSFFPKLIAGPLIRCRDLDRQIDAPAFSLASVAAGLRRFAFGLAKKALLAAPLGGLADFVFGAPPGQLSAGIAWLGALGFALQIYYDFSGYTDMALGAAQMLGYRLPENFNYPYFAQSISDFWRRWHITLSNWFRDYVYFPLERRRNRRQNFAVYGNILIVFLLTGLWHGAAWTFIAWGLAQGGFIALERTRFGSWLSARPAALRHLYAGLAILASWVIFRSPSLGSAAAYLGAMLGLNGAAGLYDPALALNNERLLALLIGGLLAVPLWPGLQARLAGSDPAHPRYGAWGPVVAGGLALLLLIASALYLAGAAAQPFIYFRF